MTPSCVRLPEPTVGRDADAGLKERYPIEIAPWLWHPDLSSDDEALVEFGLDLELDSEASIPLQISADQRFELRIADQLLACGPDRSEVLGWSFSRYALKLPAGQHQLRILVSYFTTNKANAQCSHKPGLVIAGLDGWDERIGTGQANWRVRRRQDISILPWDRQQLSYHVIGPAFQLDGSEAEAWCTPTKRTRFRDLTCGQRPAGWTLEPSCLPEQQRQPITGGRIRGRREDHVDTAWEETAVTESVQALCRGDAIHIAANKELTLLWDLEQYYCGSLQASCTDGAGSSILVEWAESLYAAESAETVCSTDAKDRRDAITGKYWLGFGDRIDHPGGQRDYQVPWWRSGRFLRIRIRTAAEALNLKVLPQSTGYPVQMLDEVECDDADLQPIAALCRHVLAMCSHDTFIDCPYYEQMNYVGDTRVQALVVHVTQADDRLVRRCLELFDRSRWATGMVSERCPSEPIQSSPTYSALYVLMLRDFAYWRRDPAFIRRLLPGMRAMLHTLMAHTNADGLWQDPPGWSFIDWVYDHDWQRGVPGDGQCIGSANLQLLAALQAADELEAAHGEADMQALWRGRAAKLQTAIKEHFWDDTRQRYGESRGGGQASQHAQALAIITGCAEAERQPGCLAALSDDQLPRCSVYYSFYRFESLAQLDRGDAILDGIGFWRELLGEGFTTVIESPEPARSDCHAWGAHPLYHYHASLLGIRPASPGFTTARIRPSPGPLKRLRSSIPHPDGQLKVDMRQQVDGWHIRIDSPVPVSLHWHDQDHSLDAGRHTVHLPL